MVLVAKWGTFVGIVGVERPFLTAHRRLASSPSLQSPGTHLPSLFFVSTFIAMSPMSQHQTATERLFPAYTIALRENNVTVLSQSVRGIGRQLDGVELSYQSSLLSRPGQFAQNYYVLHLSQEANA